MSVRLHQVSVRLPQVNVSVRLPQVSVRLPQVNVSVRLSQVTVSVRLPQVNVSVRLPQVTVSVRLSQLLQGKSIPQYGTLDRIEAGSGASDGRFSGDCDDEDEDGCAGSGGGQVKKVLRVSKCEWTLCSSSSLLFSLFFKQTHRRSLKSKTVLRGSECKRIEAMRLPLL